MASVSVLSCSNLLLLDELDDEPGSAWGEEPSSEEPAAEDGGAWDANWVDRGKPNNVNLTGTPHAIVSDGNMYVFAIVDDPDQEPVAPGFVLTLPKAK